MLDGFNEGWIEFEALRLALEREKSAASRAANTHRVEMKL